MQPKPNEIMITRVYEAPVKLVWEAWTDLKHVEKWWGPRGFTLTTKSRDLKPGGKWIYTMHGPDGTDYPNITTYHEVVKYEKLVYDHGASEEHEKLFSVTVTFKEENGKTIMTMISTLPTPEAAKAAKQFIRQANGNSTWDRLGEHLEKETSGKDVFIINRSFEADIKTVFEMWANPEYFAKWFGPVGSTVSFIKADIRESGSSHCSITSSDGQAHYVKLNHIKVLPPHLLIYSQNFCDKDGNLSKAHFSSTYPEKLLTTVTFAEEETDETRVTVKWEIIGDASEAERQIFREFRAMSTEGWNGSFDKFESLLEQRK